MTEVHDFLAPEEFAVRRIRWFSDLSLMRDLERAWGYAGDDPNLPLGQRLEALREFSWDTWDFRNGNERWDLSFLSGGERRDRLAVETAVMLDMWERTEPAHDQYDVVGILGGGGEKNLLRQEYFFELGIKPELLVISGSHRALQRKEQRASRDFAYRATTEADLLAGAYRTLTGYKQIDELEFPTYFEKRYSGEFYDYKTGDPQWLPRECKGPVVQVYEGDGYPVFIVSAPMRAGETRANTSDTLAFTAELGRDYLGPDKRFLGVTSAISRMAQELDAIKTITLPTGAHAEVVGFGRAYKMSELDKRAVTMGRQAMAEAVLWTPTDAVQEIHAAVNSAYWLQRAAAKSARRQLAA